MWAPLKALSTLDALIIPFTCADSINQKYMNLNRCIMGLMTILVLCENSIESFIEF